MKLKFEHYIENENQIALIHTESPTELSETRVATALVEKTLF
jgi:hypothetical protein